MILTANTYRKGNRLLTAFRQSTLYFIAILTIMVMAVLLTSGIVAATILACMSAGVYFLVRTMLGRKVSIQSEAQLDESGLRIRNLLDKNVFVPLEELSFQKGYVVGDEGNIKASFVLECQQLQPIIVAHSEYDSDWIHFAQRFPKSDFEMTDREKWMDLIAILEAYCNKID